MSDYITIPLSKKGRKYKGMYEAIVDNEDKVLDKVSWCVRKHNEQVYAHRNAYENGKYHNTYLHRVILERMLGRPLEKGEQADHIDGNGLDNRRYNLRLATHRQNSINSRLSCVNKTGYKGISWRKEKKKFHAKIKVHGKTKHLGYFTDILDAHKAYCKAAYEYFGEFANFGETSPFSFEDFKDE